MLYPEIFRSLERIRWNMTDDVPWDALDGTLLFARTFYIGQGSELLSAGDNRRLGIAFVATSTHA